MGPERRISNPGPHVPLPTPISPYPLSLTAEEWRQNVAHGETHGTNAQEKNGAPPFHAWGEKSALVPPGHCFSARCPPTAVRRVLLLTTDGGRQPARL